MIRFATLSTSKCAIKSILFMERDCADMNQTLSVTFHVPVKVKAMTGSGYQQQLTLQRYKGRKAY
jgi:hypothetical protein